MPADRFSTATRLKALGTRAAGRVYRVRTRRLRGPRRVRLTGRAALLALVVCTLVVALAYPMRQYVSQQAEIDAQLEKAQRARDRVKELREERARWRDPAFVESQARQRLGYVRPGETGYTVVDGRGGIAPPSSRGPTDLSWYEKLLGGLDAADKDR